MSDTDNGTAVESGPDYLKLTTDIVTLVGAIISTWYVLDLVTHDAATDRVKREWAKLRASWQAARRRRQFRDTTPGLLYWEAEEALKGQP